MSNQEKLGYTGEVIVQSYLKEFENLNVELSQHKFDMMKDILDIDNNVLIEVKTQLPKQWGKDVLGRLCEVFTVPAVRPDGREYQNQPKKCKMVDRLLFVRVPYNEMGDSVEIWEAPAPEDRNFRKEHNQYHNSTVLSIPIRECTLKHVYTESRIANEVRKYCTANELYKTKPKHFYSEVSYE